MINLHHVSKSFGTGVQKRVILQDVSISIDAGAFTTLSAPSGSGKSTLLNLIGCLDKPNDGTVEIDGADTARLSDRELALFRNEKIGFIFQSFYLIPVLSALENVAYPLALRGVARRIRHAESRAMLERVGLGDHIRKRPKHLSGGQRQRVAIARALVSNPRIVLADEPSANLDADTAQDIIRLMKSLNREKGSTFLISTHDPKIAAHARKCLTIADRKLVDADVA